MRKRVFLALVAFLATGVWPLFVQTSTIAAEIDPGSADIEALLMNVVKMTAPCVDFARPVVFPKSEEYWLSWASLVIAASEDTAFIITVGQSEVIVKQVEMASKGGDAVAVALDIAKAQAAAVAGRPGAAGDFAVGRFADLSIRGVEKWVGKSVPGLRTGVAVYFVFEASRAEKARVVAALEKQRSILAFAQDTGALVSAAQLMINRLPAGTARDRYEQVLTLVLQRAAEIAVYREFVRDNFVGSAGIAMDSAIDGAIPGIASGTINAAFVDMVEAFIDGRPYGMLAMAEPGAGFSEETFRAQVEAEIARRIGSIPRTSVVRVLSAIRTQLDEVLRRRHQLNKYGGSAICGSTAIKTFGALASTLGVRADRGTVEAIGPTATASEWALSSGGATGLDLIFCIDTTSSMRDDIDAAKAAATRIIDSVFAASPDPRVALVAYRDFEDEYVTMPWAFTHEKEEIKANVMGLRIAGGGDTPEAVYDALLAAINTEGLGEWRTGVKKVIILIGDAPPHGRRATLEQVVKRAEEVDPAHIYPIAVAGSSDQTREAFVALAERTGGLMLETATAEELPKRLIEMVGISSGLADTDLRTCTVTRVLGGYAWVQVPGSCRAGLTVVFVDPGEGRRVIGRGHITSCTGESATVEIQETHGKPLTIASRAIVVPY